MITVSRVSRTYRLRGRTRALDDPARAREEAVAAADAARSLSCREFLHGYV
jgi:hypothetical protein